MSRHIIAVFRRGGENRREMENWTSRNSSPDRVNIFRKSAKFIPILPQTATSHLSVENFEIILNVPAD